MKEPLYSRPHIRAGQPTKLVCWLVVPTAMDARMPEDCTLMYVLTEPYDGSRNRPPPVIFESIGRDQVASMSRELYLRNKPHGFHTQWIDPTGRRVHKIKRSESEPA